MALIINKMSLLADTDVHEYLSRFQKVRNLSSIFDRGRHWRALMFRNRAISKSMHWVGL